MTSVPRALVVDFGSGNLILPGLNGLGWETELVDMAVADAHVDDPERLAAEFGPNLVGGGSLIFAFGDGPVGGASTCAWGASVHPTLTRCFAFVRALGPVVRDSGGGCICLLPLTAIWPSARLGAAATFHRALLGLFEALRAETDEMGVSIVFLGDGENAQNLARRLLEVSKRRGMYSLPPAADDAALTTHYAAMLAAAEATPRAPDFPLPPTPMGAVYATEIEEAQLRTANTA